MLLLQRLLLLLINLTSTKCGFCPSTAVAFAIVAVVAVDAADTGVHSTDAATLLELLLLTVWLNWFSF